MFAVYCGKPRRSVCRLASWQGRAGNASRGDGANSERPNQVCDHVIPAASPPIPSAPASSLIMASEKVRRLHHLITTPSAHAASFCSPFSLRMISLVRPIRGGRTRIQKNRKGQIRLSNKGYPGQASQRSEQAALARHNPSARIHHHVSTVSRILHHVSTVSALVRH